MHKNKPSSSNQIKFKALEEGTLLKFIKDCNIIFGNILHPDE